MTRHGDDNDLHSPRHTHTADIRRALSGHLHTVPSTVNTTTTHIPPTPMTDAMAAQDRPKWSRAAREPSDATTSSSSSPPRMAPASTAPSSGPQRKGSNGSPSRKDKRDGKPGRKKVAKACLSCQKSHLTCDEGA